MFKKILKYKDELENTKLPQLNRRFENGKKLVNLLFRKPIIEVNDIPDEVEVSLSTASRLIKDFIELDIIREYTGYSRNRKYIMWELWKCISNATQIRYYSNSSFGNHSIALIF